MGASVTGAGLLRQRGDPALSAASAGAGTGGDSPLVRRRFRADGVDVETGLVAPEAEAAGLFFGGAGRQAAVLSGSPWQAQSLRI